MFCVLCVYVYETKKRSIYSFLVVFFFSLLKPSAANAVEEAFHLNQRWLSIEM